MKLGDFESNVSADELAKKLNDLDGSSVADIQAEEVKQARVEVHATVQNAPNFNSLVKERVDGEDMQLMSLWTSLRRTTSIGRSGAWASTCTVRFGARRSRSVHMPERPPVAGKQIGRQASVRTWSEFEGAKGDIFVWCRC